MATTLISVRMTDVEGLHYRVPLFFDFSDVDTVAKAQAQVDAYEPLFEAVSGCVIDEAEVSFPITVSGTGSPDVGYSVRSGAWLAFQDSDGVGSGLYLPAILGAMIANDSVIDTQTNMAALLAAMTGTGANGEKPLSTRGSGSLWTTYRGGKGASRKVK